MTIYRNDDPPEEDMTCRICHFEEGDCTCPECETCGDMGNPDCINVHMPWSKWGHFQFQPSDTQMRMEIEFERKQADLEKEIEEHLAGLTEDIKFLGRTGGL